jgi:hypothetical protein
MTPDRARIFAHQVREKLALPLYAVGHIEDVILKACAEQRETDAKICRAQGDKSGDDYEAGGCYGCETAIREGK